MSDEECRELLSHPVRPALLSTVRADGRPMPPPCRPIRYYLDGGAGPAFAFVLLEARAGRESS